MNCENMMGGMGMSGNMIGGMRIGGKMMGGTRLGYIYNVLNGNRREYD